MSTVTASTTQKANPDSTNLDRSPKTHRRAKSGEPRTRAGQTPNGTVGGPREKRPSTGSRIPYRSSSAGGDVDHKKASPGVTRKHASTAKPPPGEVGKGGRISSKPVLRTSTADELKQRRTPGSEEKPSSGLGKRPSSGSDDSNSKKTSPGSSRKGSGVAKPPSGGLTREELRQKRMSPSMARRQPGSTRPAGGSGRLSGAAKSPAGSKDGKHTDGVKSGKSGKDRSQTDGVGLPDGEEKSGGERKGRSEKKTDSGDEGEGRGSPRSGGNSPGGEEKEDGETASNGSRSPGSETKVITGKKLGGGRGGGGGGGGGDGSERERKTSSEKRKGSGSESPGSERKASSGKARGSGGDRLGKERKTGGEKKTIGGGPSPGSERKTSAIRKPGSGGESPGTGRKASGEKSPGTLRKASAVERKPGSPRPVRSSLAHSETSTLATNAVKRVGTRSLQRGASASTLPVSSQGSRTLGKVIALDPEDIKDDERVMSTLKLFGVKGASSGGPTVTRMSKGPVIKPIGMGASGSGKTPPIRKISSPRGPSGIAGAKAIAKTGSGGALARKPSPMDVKSRLHSANDSGSAGPLARKPSPKDVKNRLCSSDDLKTTHSPADGSGKTGNANSPIQSGQQTKTSVSKTRSGEQTGPVQRERQRMGSAPPSSARAKTAGGTAENSPLLKSSSPKKPTNKTQGIVSRPSCRGSEVKSKIALWSEKEKAAKERQRSLSPRSARLQSAPTPSPLPPSSPRASSPSSPASPHISPRTSPHLLSPHSSPHPSPHHSPRSSPHTSPHPSPPSSHSPSPHLSPASSPKALRRQAPVKQRPLSSSSRSASGSNRSSRASSKGKSISPTQETPEIRVREGEEEKGVEGEVYDDVVVAVREVAEPSAQGDSVAEEPQASMDDDVYEDVMAPSAQNIGVGKTESRKEGELEENQVAPQIEDEVYEDVVVSVEKPPAAPPSTVPVGEDTESPRQTESPAQPQLTVTEPCTVTEENVTHAAPEVQEDIYATIPEIYNNFPRYIDMREQGPPPDLPPRPGEVRDESQRLLSEGGDSVHRLEDDVYDDVMSQDHRQLAKVDSDPTYSVVRATEESTVAADMKILQKAASTETPKNKRKWLRSPLFSRRKDSDEKEQQEEGGASDRERSEKKEEGFIKRLGKIGSRSSKERRAVKRRSAQIDGPNHSPSSSMDRNSKASYNSDSEGSSFEGSPLPPAVNACEEGLHSKSSVELSKTDTLEPTAIPRSSSYSPSPGPEVEYMVTTHKKLDPYSQRVVPHHVGASEAPRDQRRPASESGIETNAVVKRTLAKPSVIRKAASVAAKHQKVFQTDEGMNLSQDILAIIDSMEGSEFLESYYKKLTPPPEDACGSAPENRLKPPVPFQLKSSSSHPNLAATVGFDIPETNGPNSDVSSSAVPNGVVVGGARHEEDRGQASDSSTGSDAEPSPTGLGEEEEEEEEEEEVGTFPIESSLDMGRHSRYSIKRKLSASAERGTRLLPVREGVPEGLKRMATEENSENLIATSLMYADAVWDRVALESDELSFRVGEVIEILDMTDDMWWQGSVRDRSGWFPSSFVRLRIAQEGDDELPELPPARGATLPRPTASTIPASDFTYSRQTSYTRRRMTIRRKDSCPTLPRKLTPSEVRAKVIEEILNTERDYVRHLEDIIEGFLKKCRENTKLFDHQKIETVFSNVEQVYAFQRDFLRELESRVDHHRMEESQIGEVFVANRHEFAIYSEYCNNHPHAVNEMCVLQRKEQYAFFFESCRLLRNLQDISLEGFLLTPVQKICKYPLQLSELLKYTTEDHPDRPHVEAAVEAMRQVAMQINEQKRRMENIGKIGRWQEGIENWKGPDILETSTEMIHSSELHKISKGHSQERHFFLFDHQLIYCKKDAIGGKLSYKGRLSTETCTVTDLPDGAETHNGSGVKNAWKMDNQAKGKVYIIYAKTAEAKRKWMEAFQKEKERVREDRERGFNVSMRMKRAAAALSHSTGVAVAKRRKSFSRTKPFKIQALSESVDSGVKLKADGSPARDRKGKFLIKKLNF